MSARDPGRRYREVQVTTAAKDDLLLLLLDGAVRFTEGALLELDEKEEDPARRNDGLLRAQKIVLELMSALSPAIGLDLYANLQELYRFTFSRLFEGNVHADRKLVGEGLEMLKRIRELWRDAVEKARKERSAPPQNPLPNSTISVKG
ncbi:MAG: flagellar export chaperone FliS [Planctomycetota bacterium]